MFATTPVPTSDAGRSVEKELDRARRRFDRLAASGVESQVRGELSDVWAECGVSDWDGRDALPVGIDSYRLAERFLRALPLGVRLPEIGAEPDGMLTFEWHGGVRRTVSVSFDPSGDLHWAALLGPDKLCGTATFPDRVPALLLDLIARTA